MVGSASSSRHTLGLRLLQKLIRRLYCLQHGIATSSRSESSRFRPVNRKAASHSREELDEKLDKLVLRFPRTKRKYNFREAAQHWVDCFKRENIYHHWHDEEPSKRQHVWKQLDDVPARLEQRRKNHNPLNPWFVLVGAISRSFAARSSSLTSFGLSLTVSPR